MDVLLSVNSAAVLSPVKDIALLVPRVIFAAVFFYYGWPKIKDLKANARDFEEMGFRPGWLWGTPIALLETGGSLLILLGLYFAVIPLFFAAHMATGTVWKITSTEKPFTDWSYDLILLALAILFTLTGPGAINLLTLVGG